MDLRGASGEALRALSTELAEVATGDLARLGEELYALSALLRQEGRVRRMLTDPSVAAEAKQGMAHALFDGKVDQPAVALLASAAGRRWASPADLPSALQRLAELAVVRSAGDDPAQLAGELFSFSRLISQHPDLRAALTDSGRSREDRSALVDKLLADKVHPATLALAKQSLGGSYRDPLVALEAYQEVAAEVSGHGVATVRVARALSAEHAGRLAAALQTRYGHPVRLNVVVDPDVVGGISVAIGDEVIDGTVSTRLAEAGRKLAG